MPIHESNDEMMATQVADCPQCNALFTLPVAAELFEAVRCPGCSAQLKLDSISMRKVHVAEAVTELNLVTEPTEETEATTGQESLEDWLKRTTGVSLSVPSVSEPEEETHQVEEEEPNPPSQTVEWKPGSFNLETPEETTEADDTTFQLNQEMEPEEQSADEPVRSIESLLQEAEQQLSESEEQLSNAQSDSKIDQPAAFRLPDFELSEESVPESEASIANEFLTREEEIQEEIQEVIEEHDDPAEILNRLESVHKKDRPRNRFGVAVSAIAGLLVIGGVSYVVIANQFASPDEGLVAQQANDVSTTPNNDDQIDELAGSSYEEGSITAKDPEVVAASANLDVAQASFNEPSEEPALPESDSEKTISSENTVGDRYAQNELSVIEPNLFTPPIEQKTLPRERLVGAPTYSAEELQQATNYSEAMVKQLLQATSMEGADRDQALGKHYAELCYLAQVVSLLDLNSTSQDLKTTEMMAVELYKKLFYEERAIEPINQVAEQWIQWAERPYGGVFLTGIPDDMQYAGELIQYRMPVGNTHVMIVTEEPINIDRYVMSDSQLMGVIGIVVEDPAQRIAGYEGDAERVIWCRKTIPVGDKPWAR